MAVGPERPYEPHPHDRRREERVPGGDLMAELIVGPGQSYESRVVNTSANGARLALRAAGDVRFPLGTLLEVRFRVLGVERPLVTLAQVGNQSRGDGDGDSLEVGVRFVERERFYAQLTPRMWERFNRRRRRRVRLAATTAPARIESGGRVWHAPLCDLSEIGFSFDLSAELAHELARYELLRALFHLPDGAPIGLGGILVHQTPFGHALRQGMVIDPAHTADLAGQQARIAALVVRGGA